MNDPGRPARARAWLVAGGPVRGITAGERLLHVAHREGLTLFALRCE
jgi:hypothetical protein